MIEYTDPYLSPLASPERELRATGDVAALGTFDTSWRDKLIVLRVYMIICMESMQTDNDAFAVRLNNYRKEFNQVLIQAKAASAATTSASLFFVPLERS